MYKECRHIKPNGCKCHSPALKDMPYCYYHLRLHKVGRALRTPSAPYEQREVDMPFLEDRGAVQIALSEVVSALAERRIEFKRAGLMIYALQVASANAKNSQDIVSVQQVREASRTDEGDELALEVTTYEEHDEEYKDPDREPTLADLILAEMRRQREPRPAEVETGWEDPSEFPDFPSDDTDFLSGRLEFQSGDPDFPSGTPKSFEDRTLQATDEE